MEERKEKRKKWKIGLLPLFIALVVITGASLAYFSDVILGSGSATSGTLDLNANNRTAAQWYTQGGVEGSNTLTVTAGVVSAVNNLNPGDIIEISYDLSNNGNKSALVRDIYNMVITPRSGQTIATAGMFEIYKSTPANPITRAEIRNGDVSPVATATASGMTNVTTNPVIYNGTGTGAETETGGITATTASPEAVTYFIYFKPAATNEYQGASITFTTRTEAVQYRNNTTTPEWTNATSLLTEFSLTP